MKLARGSELVIASHNPGKVREIHELIEPYGVIALGAVELGLEEPEETGTSFVENSVLKASLAAKASGRIALADDSGLAVSALDGAPGIYSARWAGPARDFSAAMARVESELKAKGTKDLSAMFVCALSLAAPNDEARTFVGTVNGQLTFPPRGDKGFGYDPIFIADGMRETFGEIAPATKHGMSHRARAFEKLVASDIFSK